LRANGLSISRGAHLHPYKRSSLSGVRLEDEIAEHVAAAAVSSRCFADGNPSSVPLIQPNSAHSAQAILLGW
jgi:hypothetical protein